MADGPYKSSPGFSLVALASVAGQSALLLNQPMLDHDRLRALIRAREILRKLMLPWVGGDPSCRRI